MQLVVCLYVRVGAGVHLLRVGMMGRLLSHTTQCACVGTCTVLHMVSYAALTWRCVAVAPRSKRPLAVVQPVDVTTVLE